MVHQLTASDYAAPTARSEMGESGPPATQPTPADMAAMPLAKVQEVITAQMTKVMKMQQKEDKETNKIRERIRAQIAWAKETASTVGATALVDKMNRKKATPQVDKRELGEANKTPDLLSDKKNTKGAMSDVEFEGFDDPN